MLIKQTRIYSLSKFSFLKKWEKISIRVMITKDITLKFNLKDLVDDVLILPPIVWPISMYNAEGKELILKNQHKETFYREARVKDWHGNYHNVDIPRKRYPRQLLLPQWSQFYRKDNYIYSEEFFFWENDQLLLHTINLFLELFWECELLDQEKTPIFNTSNINRFNREFIKQWTTWSEFKNNINPILTRTSPSKKYIIETRLKAMELMWLNPVWIGVYGFYWYIAFSRSGNKNYTIFESIKYGNAIYITEEEWVDFSKRNKQDILSSWTYLARIIHTTGRQEELKKYLI